MIGLMRLIPVAILALALNACATNVVAEKASRFDQGVAAYDSGDYATAYKIWDQLAREDDLAAKRNVAQLLRQGKGVDKDVKRAFRLYLDAAEKGLVTAMANAGDMYLSGEGVEKNAEAAAAWYSRAASAGLSLAQWKLAELYEQGVGVQKDPQRARSLLERAARNGYVPAQNKLKSQGVALAENGAVIASVPSATASPQSPKSDGTPAPGFFDRLLGSGSQEPPGMSPANPIAPDVIAKMPQSELTSVYAGIAAYSAHDTKNAFNLWFDSATRGNAEAQLRVALLYERGEGVRQDILESYRWLRHSAAQGHPQGIAELARLSPRLAPAERAIAESLVKEPVSKLKKPN